MKAVVGPMTEAQAEDLWAETGQEIEVIGFVTRGWQLMAVWRDDLGEVYEVPANLIRMLPYVQDKAA